MQILFNNRPSPDQQIDPRRLAVLAVHWQNDLVRPDGAFGPIFAEEVKRQQLVPRMLRLLQSVRAAGGTVIHVQAAFHAGFKEVICNSGLWTTAVKTNAFVRGTSGVEIIEELTPEPDDFVLEHSRISAFYGTELDLLLRKRAIDAVAVTGVATNVAVDHTVRDALELGFNTMVVEDCCCSSSLEFHDAALKTLRVLATSVVTADQLVHRFSSAAE